MLYLLLSTMRHLVPPDENAAAEDYAIGTLLVVSLIGAVVGGGAITVLN